MTPIRYQLYYAKLVTKHGPRPHGWVTGSDEDSAKDAFVLSNLKYFRKMVKTTKHPEADSSGRKKEVVAAEND